MAISKENILFVYNSSDSDSISLANYYKDIKNLNSEQLLGINPSPNDELLANYSTFQSQIENPIKNYITNTLIPLEYNITVIIIGYNLPSGFIDTDNISITSRLSRIWHTYVKQENNPIYNRLNYQAYDSQDPQYALLDSQYALIVSKIDAPTFQLAKDMIDGANSLINQGTINGYIYFNPYIGRSLSTFENYQNKMFNSKTYILPYLNINIKDIVSPSSNSTVVQYQFLQGDDAIFWGGGNSTGSSNFFQQESTNRYFFYDADTSSALNIRDNTALNWVRLSLSNGYASACGQLSDPNTGFLDPEMFFFSIYNWSTLGEAVLFSSPYLNWTNCLFGDPLISSKPKIDPNYYTEIYNEMETWRLLNKTVSSLVSYDILNENISNDIVDTIGFSQDISVELDILYQAYNNSLVSSSAERSKTFPPVIGSLFQYATTRFINSDGAFSDINTFLTTYNNKVSRTVLDIAGYQNGEDYIYSGQTISSANIYPISNDTTKGYWEIEFTFIPNVSDVFDYTFKLEVYSDLNSSALYTIYSNTSNWLMETYRCGNVSRFISLPSTGISWNNYGKRIKYESTEDVYLDRKKVYYFKITPRWNSNINTGTPLIIEQIIYS